MTSISSSRRRVLTTSLAAASSVLLPTFATAQTTPPGSTLRLGFIGPGKKPASATGWALSQVGWEISVSPR